MPFSSTGAGRAAASAKYAAEPPKDSWRCSGVVASSRCSVPATAIFQVTEPFSAGCDAGGAVSEQGNDLGQRRRTVAPGTHQEHLLRGEQDVGDMLRVAIDTELVTQPRVDLAHRPGDRAP